MSENITQSQFDREVAAVNADKDLTADQRAKKLEYLQTALLASQTNSSRSGKGTRVAVGSTRGKGSMVISYEEFDLDSPETLPQSLKEFTELAGVSEPSALLELVLRGFNSLALTTASDPIAEFVNSNWDKDTASQFRNVVRNMTKGAGMPIEVVVNLVKPGFESKFASASK